MIRIEYPKDRQRLKESYLKVFKSYKKLQKMQDKWEDLREAHTCLLMFPPKLETILVAEYPELIRYYNLYKRIPNEERKLMKEKLKDIFNYEERNDMIVKFLVNPSNNIPPSILAIIAICHKSTCMKTMTLTKAGAFSLTWIMFWIKERVPL